MSDNVVELIFRQRQEGQNVARETSRDLDEMKRKAMEATRAENPTTVDAIKRLYSAAGNYESKGMLDAAKSARGDARVLEKDLERAAKERLGAEQSISREHRERAAMTRAAEAAASRRENALMRIGRAGAGLVESATGGSAIGGVAGAAGGALGVAGLIAGAVVGVIAAMAKQRDQEKLIGMEDVRERTVLGRRLSRLGGFEGSAGSAREFAESEKDDRIQRIADRARLEEEARPKWYSLKSLFNYATGSNRNEINKNDNAIQRDLEAEAKSRDIAREKFEKFVKPEIEVAQLRANAQYKEARAVEDVLTYRKEIDRLKGQDATPEEAEAGAQAKLRNILRDRAGSFARLVTARDGAGDTARIAGLARDQRLAGLDQLRSDMNRNHSEATSTVSRKNFFDR